jgi:maleate isomerase
MSMQHLGIFIDYGERLRIGMLVPSGNVIVEPQVRAMLPRGVAVYTTRLPLTGSSEAELVAMVENIEGAARLLADARVNLIAFNCTAVSTFSKAMEAGIKGRIEQATGIAATATSEALVAALGAVSARRVVLLTPYLQVVNDREVAFLEKEGLEVLSETGLGLNLSRDMAALPPVTWIDLARRHRDDRAEAYLISCTAIRSAEVIQFMEQELGCPVITSNQALVWHCLRLGGIEDQVEGFGSVFARAMARREGGRAYSPRRTTS